MMALLRKQLQTQIGSKQQQQNMMQQQLMTMMQQQQQQQQVQLMFGHVFKTDKQ